MFHNRTGHSSTRNEFISWGGFIDDYRVIQGWILSTGKWKQELEEMDNLYRQANWKYVHASTYISTKIYLYIHFTAVSKSTKLILEAVKHLFIPFDNYGGRLSINKDLFCAVLTQYIAAFPMSGQTVIRTVRNGSSYIPTWACFGTAQLQTVLGKEFTVR